MHSSWTKPAPDVLVAPEPVFGPISIRAPRFVSRDLVRPNADGRIVRSRLADVLATVADVTPLSLYETTAEDVTEVLGRSVHCYFTGDDEALVETVDPQGWRRFTFVSEARLRARLVLALATKVPSSVDRVIACTLDDGRDSVLLSDGMSLLLGDLPRDRGPVRQSVAVQPEDVRLLLLARLHVPAAA